MKSSTVHWSSSQRGGGLIEAIAAIALLAVIMSILLKGLSTSYISEGKNSLQSIAETIARNQIEYVFEQSYLAPAAAYDTIAPPQGFSVVVEALEYVATDPDVEKIRVEVYHQTKKLLMVETLRSNH